MAQTKGLAKKTVTSVIVTYLGFILTKSMTLIVTAVLARLLTKGEFGIVGFATTAMSFLDAVSDLGISLALIQRRDNVEEAAHTAFWMNLISSFVMWILACVAAPFVADFFREDQVKTILPVLAFSFVITSFGSVNSALLQREMQFSRRVIPSVGESLSKGVLSIGLALSGFGVWALVIGQVVGRLVYTVITLFVKPWRPRWQFSRSLAGSIFNYGYKISLDSLISNFQANIDYIFIGRFLGDEALGLYTVAFRIPELIIINLCVVIAQVLFPAYSILQEDREQLKAGMLGAIRYVTLITLPAGVGLALVSEPFVAVLFGNEWLDAAPMMAALAVYGIFLSVSWNIGDIYKAVGRPDILWVTSLLEFAILAPVLYWMSHYSAFAVSVGHALVALVVSISRLLIAAWLLKVSVWEIAKQFIPSLVGAGAMAIPVLAVLTLDWSPVPLLAFAILAGAAAYAGVIAWFEGDLVEEIEYRFLTRREKPEAEAT